jgi:hypothetical protein
VSTPILIFLAGFLAGAIAPARWLPDVGDGRVAGLAFLLICGLLGIVVALVAVHVYEIVRQLNNATVLGLGGEKPDVVANGITTTLSQIGPVLGIAAVVYLLAPAPREEQIAVASHTAPPHYSNQPTG